MVMRQCLPMLKKAGSPRSSTSSKVGSIADNTSSRLCLSDFENRPKQVTKNLALEFPDWTIMALHPGWVATDMGGQQAPTQVEESVDGLYLVMQNENSSNGKFVDFRGDELPW